jgi:Ala-tRNA(Pro) deacylase
LKYKSGSLRFADNSLLESILGVHQGHLSLFAKVNDVDKKVQVILDKRLLDAENVSLHPLVNTSSTIISGADFKRFADKYAAGYKVMEFN